MADPKRFCPYCGAQQLKADARFCHVCGQPLPTPLPQPLPYAGRGKEEGPPPPPQGGGRGVGPQGGGRGIGLWLVPFLLALAVIAAAAVAWQRGLLDLGGRGRAAWTPAALSEKAAGGSSLPGDTSGAGTAATPTAPTAGFPAPTLAPPAHTPPPPARVTPQDTATPRPTATPPPTATPAPTSTPTATPTPVIPTPVVGQVIFAGDRNGYAHIFSIRGDGQRLRAITGGNEYFWAPIFSHDGALVAYVSKINGNTEIFIARSDGGNARPISNHPAEDDHPAWFPGNRALAFASRRDGAWEIYRMNADGSEVRRLTFEGGDNRFVDVSPDDGRIAYVSLNTGYPGIDLMIMDADGGNRRLLYSFTSHKQRDDPDRFVSRPDWSPDGTRLAFGADDDDDGLISIVIIDAATGQAQRLIRDGNGPAWSPDGLRLIYKPAGERQILFVADAAGNRLYQLTGSEYNAWSPDWAR